MYLTTKSTPNGRLVVDLVTGRTAPYHNLASYRLAERSVLDYRNQVIELMVGPVPIERFSLPEWQSMFYGHFYGIPRLSLP